MTLAHEEALRALRIADRDIVAFTALINAPQVSLASSCFFAQQAVEKCLKAVLFEQGEMIFWPRTASSVFHYLISNERQLRYSGFGSGYICSQKFTIKINDAKHHTRTSRRVDKRSASTVPALTRWMRCAYPPLYYFFALNQTVLYKIVQPVETV